MMEEDPELLQLMWADFKHSPNRHFYIKEVAKLRDGRMVIPMKWVVVLAPHSDVEKECADVYLVEEDPGVSVNIKTCSGQFTY